MAGERRQCGVGRRPAPPPPPRGDERNQRDAVRRRHAGAAHRVHGVGAAADRRRAGRSAAKPSQVARSGSRAADSFGQRASGQIFLQNSEIKIDELVAKLKAVTMRAGRRGAHLCARRQESGLRYDDAGDGTALGGRLSPRRAGDRGRAGRLMKRSVIISSIAHVVVLGWETGRLRREAERRAAGRSAARRVHIRKPALAADRWREDVPRRGITRAAGR